VTQDRAHSRRIIEREATRLSRLDATRLAEELRELRLGLNVSQAAVAHLVGVSQSVISELERGVPTVGLEVRRRAAIVLGADLRVAVYPGATPMLHDAAHARIIHRLLRRRHSRWRAEVEARVPGPGRSSTDVRLTAAHTVVLIEIETRLRRWEATVRRCFDKRSESVIQLRWARTSSWSSVSRRHDITGSWWLTWMRTFELRSRRRRTRSCGHCRTAPSGQATASCGSPAVFRGPSGRMSPNSGR